MLKEKLNDDLKSAMKEGDALRRDTLRMLTSSVKNKAIEKHTELTDEQILEVIASECKKRKDSAAQFVAGGRPELAEKESAELAILASYLPEQVDDTVIEAAVAEAIVATGALGPREMGAVMAEVMKTLKGKADGSRVNEFVRKALTPK